MKVGPPLTGTRSYRSPRCRAPVAGGLAPPRPKRPPARPGKALVLNATMEPLCVVPARRAVVLVLSAKADVVQTNGHRFRSAELDLAAPSVVRLRAYVRVPYRRRAALSRRGVFIRDEHRASTAAAPRKTSTT